MFLKVQVAVIPLIGLLIGCMGQSSIQKSAADKPTVGSAAPQTVVPHSSTDDDWAEYRGSNGQGDGTMSVIPTQWSNKKNIVWKTKLIGRGASSPIIVGDRVFITAYTGFGIAAYERAKKSDLRLHLVCLDRATGKQKWIRSIQGSPAVQTPNEDFLLHGSASSTAVSDGERVYAFFGVSGVFAFDMDGKFLWQADVGSSTHNFGTSASPTIYQDLLIVNASIESKQVFAFDKLNGSVKWILDNVEQSWSTPSVGVSAEGRPELIVSESFFVHGINPLTGEKYWTCDGIQDYVVPRPVVHDDMAFVSGGKESRIMGIRLGGTGEVTKINKLWESRLIGNVPTPVYLNGQLFVVGENGILQRFSADTGKLLNKDRVKVKQRVFAGLVKSRDHFFIATSGLGVTVIDQAKPNKVLKSNLVDPGGAVVRGDCSIAGNRLFYRTDDWLYCVGHHRGPPNENEVEIDQQPEVIVPKPKPDFDEAQLKTKQYVRYMSGTKEETIALLLRPYDSIITPGEEREKLNQLVGGYWDQYVEIRADHHQVLMKQNLISDEAYIAEFDTIGQRMMALERLVRSKVRPTFSKEQMAKHKAEAEAWLEKQAEKKKSAQ